MNLKVFILSICVVIVSGITFIFYRETESVLGRHFREIERMHSQSVREFAATALSARKYLLSAYRESLDKDNQLSKLLLMNRHGQAFSGKVREELRQLRAKTSLDIVDFVYVNDGEALINEDFGKNRTPIARIREGKTDFEIRAVEGKLALLSYSPLYLFRDVLAVAVLGYYLNDGIAKDVSLATNTTVEFFDKIYTGKKSTAEIQFAGDAGPGQLVRIGIDSQLLDRETHDVRRQVIIAGSVSLLLVIGLIYLLLNFGFIRAFRRVLNDMNEGAKSLDRGTVVEARAVRYPIQEVTLLSSAFSKYTRGLSAFEERIRQKSKIEAAGELATQAAHDIDGPLMALEGDLDLETSSYSEAKKRRVQGHINRIREVVGVFSEIGRRTKRSADFALRDDAKYFPESLSAGLERISRIVSEIVEEKRAQYSETEGVEFVVELEGNSDLWARVDTREFRRTLSNLLDNAVHALGGAGTVTVTARREGRLVRLDVMDTGVGIPKDVLTKLGQRGVSYGKENGSGLGLWQAIGSVASWNGDLAIESRVGKGTTVTITLPLEDAPNREGLVIDAGSRVLVLDDDPEVSEQWKRRFSELGVIPVTFSSPEALFRWRRNHGDTEIGLLLCDLELRDGGWDGFSVIEELGVLEKSVLVTSHSEKADVQERCAALGIRLVPKRAILDIPLRVTGSIAESIDAGGTHAS